MTYFESVAGQNAVEHIANAIGEIAARMQQQNERPQQLPHKGIEFVLHRPTFSRMISSNFSLLCWKSRSLVSTITASSAARSGAAERCVSL